MGTAGPTAPTCEPTSVNNAMGGAAAKGEGAVVVRRKLPSGHSLVILATSGVSEAIEIRSPTGAVEVRIACGPDGPVVSLSSARLDLEAPTIAIRCRTFEVTAERDLALRGGTLELESQGKLGIHGQGDVRLESEHDVHLHGQMLRLNCTEASSQPPAS